jgi:hypothetical protein
MKKIKLLIVTMFVATTSFTQNWGQILIEDTTSTIYFINLPPKRNICDSIIIINPDKQKQGEFIIDFRKAIETIGKKNTKWKYTYGDIGTTDIWTQSFVPDTIVAYITHTHLLQTTNSSTSIVIKEFSYTCSSKWVWNGLIWDK